MSRDRMADGMTMGKLPRRAGRTDRPRQGLYALWVAVPIILAAVALGTVLTPPAPAQSNPERDAADCRIECLTIGHSAVTPWPASGVVGVVPARDRSGPRPAGQDIDGHESLRRPAHHTPARLPVAPASPPLRGADPSEHVDRFAAGSPAGHPPRWARGVHPDRGPPPAFPAVSPPA